MHIVPLQSGREFLLLFHLKTKLPALFETSLKEERGAQGWDKEINIFENKSS